jgi:hypothetical protein
MFEIYQQRLGEIPPPGKGNGCHPYLLTVANLGVIYGLQPNQIFNDIRNSLPDGKRCVSDREIMDTIVKASNLEQNPKNYRRDPKRTCHFNHKQVFKYILEKCAAIKEEDIWEASPIRLENEPNNDASLLISRFYSPDEYIFIGNQYSKEVCKVEDFLYLDKARIEGQPHIIPNPFTGSPGLTKSGTSSYRCDNCIANLRFAMAEFDSIPKEDQLKFWASVDLPISALIDSGNKSIHAWIRVDCPDRESWQRDVKNRLYGDFLVPLGVAPACCNPSRLSRLPGHFRTDTGKYQRLLYLAPKGRRVFP